MMEYIKVDSIQVAPVLYEFINQEVLPGSQLNREKFWSDLNDIVRDLVHENHVLLSERDELQKKIDQWLKENNQDIVFDKYQAFLHEIGYLEEKVDEYQITTENVDNEITLQAGPQLVVPVNNARYAINAANARWGSLYDALYGSDAISERDGAEHQVKYNPIRGERVIQYGKEFLDQVAPLKTKSHQKANMYSIEGGQLVVTLNNGEKTELKELSKFIGYQGLAGEPSAILLKNNNLHIEVQIDRDHPIGTIDPAGVKDILMESALTTIMDCEDSVAAIDADDKVMVYRNWLGLIKGTLSATFTKGNKVIERKVNSDRIYKSSIGEGTILPGRVLMLIRNVGHLMTNPAVLDSKGNEIPEGILDCVITSLIAKHDLLGNGTYQNSKKRFDLYSKTKNAWF